MAKHIAKGCLILLSCFVLMACEDREERARYVKGPLEDINEESLASLNKAYREAETRLKSVKSGGLKAELSKDLDQEYQRLLAHIHEVERERAERAAAQEEAAREAESQRLAQVEAEARKQRELEQQLVNQATARAQKENMRQAVLDLEGGMRPSMLDDGTQVLVLSNSQPFRVDFDLRCYTRNDSTNKAMFVSVPARGEMEIGFLEGWSGNFVEGERCEAYFDGELLWNRSVPSL